MIWSDGVDDYKENKLIIDSVTGKKVHHITLKDVPTDSTKSYHDMAYDVLSNKGIVNI